MTTTGTWYPPTAGTGGFLIEGQLFTNPPLKMTLPNDYARCGGAGWEKCDDCQRRTSDGEVHMQPPSIVTFWCEYYIAPQDQKNYPQSDKLS